MTKLAADPKGRMIGRLTAAALMLGGFILPGVAHANGIASITYYGTGCPQGAVEYSLSSDRSRMTLTFDEMVASGGPGVAQGEEAKDCRIDVTMQTSEAVGLTLRTRGYVQLAKGMASEGHQHIPQSERSTFDRLFVGPTTGDYISGSTATVPAQRSASVTTFSIILRDELDNEADPSGQGGMTLESLDLQVVP